MANKLIPFLMFEGLAGEAMRLYVALFRGSKTGQVVRYGLGEQGTEGSIKRADFILCGQSIICIDSPVKHNFTFTPSVSLFVDCENEDELDTVFGQISNGGEVMMPLGTMASARIFVG